MTQAELHNQRLVKEAQDAVLQLHTRRHFLKESAMGLGALAFGSLFGGCGEMIQQIVLYLIPHIRSCQNLHISQVVPKA